MRQCKLMWSSGKPVAVLQNYNEQTSQKAWFRPNSDFVISHDVLIYGILHLSTKFQADIWNLIEAEYASVNWTIIGLDNGLSPVRHQSIILTNAGILINGPLGTNFSEILITIHIFSFTKMHLKMSGKWRPFCLTLNVLKSECHPSALV